MTSLDNFFTKKTFLTLSVFILTPFLYQLFGISIGKWLVFPEGKNIEYLIATILTIISLFLFVWVITLLHKGYIFSYQQRLGLVIIAECFLIKTLELDNNDSNTKILWLVLIPFVYLFIAFELIYKPVQFIKPIFLRLKRLIKLRLKIKHRAKKDLHNKKTLFIEDNPTESNDQYSKFSNVIIDAIKNDTYKKAFSIAIIGAWGHGKSSFLTSFKQKVSEKFKPHEVINIDFSAFWNHKSSNITQEFFTTLSEHLNEYSGALNVSLTKYVNGLTKLYKRGELVNLFDNRTNMESSSASNLYQEVETQIKQLNKKIIIYIDDLDRLNIDEVLEVLKIVRNTSNFTGVTFLVALDKNQIDQLIKDSSYLNKFFQLEFFLPELDKDILLNSFVNYLEKSSYNFKKEYLNKINETIAVKHGVFSGHITNHRDVIRIANQFILEVSLFPDILTEVSTKDMLSLSILKSNFNLFFKHICGNINSVFNNNFGILELNKVDFTKQFKEQKLQEVFPDIKEYIDNLGLNGQLRSLYDLLYELFSGRGPLNANSIKYQSNFYKLITLDYHENDLSINEIKKLFISTDFKTGIDEIVESGKLDQLMSKLESFEAEDEEHSSRFLGILFHLLSKEQVENVIYLPKVCSKIYSIFKAQKTSSTSQKQFFDECFLFVPNIKTIYKLKVVHHLIKRVHQKTIWGYKEQELTKVALNAYTDFFKFPWKVNDYELYHLFNSLKEEDWIELNELRRITLKLLNDEQKHMFLLQMLNTDEHQPYKFAFTEFVFTLFDDLNSFLVWIKKECPNTVEYQEYTSYVLQQSILGSYKKYEKFIFKHFDVKKKLHPLRGTIPEKNLKEKILVICQINKGTDSFQLMGFEYHKFSGINYASISYQNMEIDNCLTKISDKLVEGYSTYLDLSLQSELVLDELDKKAFYIKDKEGNIVIQTISVQYGGYDDLDMA